MKPPPKEPPFAGYLVEVSDGYWLAKRGWITRNMIQARAFPTEAEAEAARERFLTHGD